MPTTPTPSTPSTPTIHLPASGYLDHLQERYIEHHDVIEYTRCGHTDYVSSYERQQLERQLEHHYQRSGPRSRAPPPSAPFDPSVTSTSRYRLPPDPRAPAGSKKGARSFYVTRKDLMCPQCADSPQGFVAGLRIKGAGKRASEDQLSQDEKRGKRVKVESGRKSELESEGKGKVTDAQGMLATPPATPPPGEVGNMAPPGAPKGPKSWRMSLAEGGREGGAGGQTSKRPVSDGQFFG